MSGLHRRPRRAETLILPILCCFLGVGSSWAGETESVASQCPRIVEAPADRLCLLAEGARQQFEISLDSGELLEVEVRQIDLDVAVSFLPPDGGLGVEVDARHSPEESEEIYWVAQQNGVHQIEIRAARGALGQGSFRLRVEPLRTASELDRRRYKAHTTSVRAYMALRRGTLEGLKQAKGVFYEALELWEGLDDVVSIVDSHASLAIVLARLGSFEEADAHSREALALNQALDRPRVHGALLNNYATSLQAQGGYERAVDAFFDSVEAAREAGDRRGEAFALLNAGGVLDRLGRPWEAYAAYERAQSAAAGTTDVRLKIALLLRVGTLEWYSGELQLARTLLEEGLALARLSGHLIEQANLLVNLGRLRLDLGDRAQAKALLEESLELWVQVGNKRGRAEALRGLGRLAFQAGEYPESEAHLALTQEICRELENLPCEATVLADLGGLHLEAGRSTAAVESLEASLALWKRLEGGRLEAETLALLGRAQRRARQLEEARGVLEQALAQARKTRHWSVEVASLAELGELDVDQGLLLSARDRFQETLEALESLRSKVASPALRTSLVGSRRSYALRFIDVLYDLEKSGLSSAASEDGLRAAELVRARALLDRLLEMGAEARLQTPPELLEAEQALKRRITLLDARRFRTGFSGPPSSASMRKLEGQLDEALADLDQLAAQIRSVEPQRLALTHAEPLAEADVRALLDPDTVLLEFLLGEPRSYLWRVTSKATSIHALPGQTELRRQVEAFRRLAEGSRRRAAKVPFQRASHTLSDALFGEVAKSLDRDRLVIIPDGFLAGVPFAALTHPAAIGSGEAPLIEDFELVVLPSASSLGYLRDLSAVRRSSTRRAAVLADPVFDRQDSRLRSLRSSSRANPGEGHYSQLAETRSSAQRAGLRSFGRLPHTRSEAAELRLRLMPGDLEEALDFSASKEVFFERDLARHEVLHFATHAFLDDQRPDLSGIVLSLVDKQGRDIDGVLRLHEIYSLDMASDLVVLSACQTALGRDVEGEGPLGLSRGFLYAGAPAVVATLWQVGDAASAELMARFYRALGQPGTRPSQALQSAQSSMAQDPAWSAPYFWAGFVFLGDWQRPLGLRFQTQ